MKRSGAFTPVHEAHAIEQVVFAVQFSRPVDVSIFEKIGTLSEKFRIDLPGGGDLQGFPGSMGISLPQGTIPGAPVTGKILNRSRPDGIIECELRIEQASVLFRTLNYTRWPNVWAQTKTYLDDLISIYLSGTELAAITLHFIDKFDCDGEPSECKPRLLLREASKYVCPHVYELTDLWHSHTGAFVHPDEKTKRLLNVNVDSRDEQRSSRVVRTISIGTVLTDQFNQPGSQPLSIDAAEICAFVATRFVELHSFSKTVFRDVITDEMCKRIALVD